MGYLTPLKQQNSWERRWGARLLLLLLLLYLLLLQSFNTTSTFPLSTAAPCLQRREAIVEDSPWNLELKDHTPHLLLLLLLFLPSNVTKSFSFPQLT